MCGTHRKTKQLCKLQGKWDSHCSSQDLSAGARCLLRKLRLAVGADGERYDDGGW